MKHLLLLFSVFLILNCPFSIASAANRFVDTGNGTIYDTVSNLTWLNDANCWSTQTWDSAIAKSNALASGQCGLTDGSKAGDWHLPTIDELRIFVDAGYLYNTLNSAGFKSVQAGAYWSSTTSYTVDAWYVGMVSGILNLDGKYSSKYVWPVRSGQSGSFGSLVFSSATTSFQATVSGTQSTPTTLTLTNGGKAAVKISATTITGTDASQFSVIPGGATPCASLTPSLAAGASCTLNVTFAPTSAGAKSAALQITSNDPTTPTIKTDLTGSGTAPSYTVTSSVTGSGGSISCTTPVKQGSASTCTILPSSGYSLATLTDNGSNVKGQVSGTTYGISNIIANRTVTATFSDIGAPSITTFTLPASATSLIVAISALTASDNSGSVASYCLTESNSSSGCNWTTTKPTSYTFTSAGAKKLYAFAKDAAGNVSNSANSITTITLPIVDSTPPVATITAPLNNSTLSSLTAITGSASDAGSQVAKVEVQIARGNGIYLQSDERWGTSSYWFTATGKTSWSQQLLNTLWTEGAVYTVKARAYDTVGNISSETNSTFTYSTSAATLAYTTIALNLSSQTILQQGSVTISGKLTRLPDNGSSMKSKTISLAITKPDGALVNPSYSTQTISDLGDFSFIGLSGFDQKGSYTIQASFAGSATLSESSSTQQTLLVGSQAGYAVIVQGKIPSGEGLADHNKITNRIYNALKARGFDDANILYYNYTTSQTGVDALPDKTTIMNAVTGMADRMNGSPAPFYLIMVDHGLADTYYLGGETITPSDLNNWMTTLEGKLSSTAKAEPRFVILGFCYSGSFIPTLSAPGRIIITSATATEESIRGPLESDNIRSGELFLDDMFQKLSKGSSFTDSFSYAANTIRMKARKDNSYMSAFGDSAIQHPLIDDDGDKAGTIIASNITKTLYLGAGVTVTNAANPEDITAVAPTTFLAATDNQFTLSINTLGTADAAWAEIRLPSYNITTGTSSGQLVIDLPRVLLTRDPSDATHWTGTANLTNLYQVNPPTELLYGIYEIYYSASTKGSVSSITRAIAYKNKSVNTAPTAPQLTTPADGEKIKTLALFNWKASYDADSDPITYTLTIKDATGNTVYKEEEIAVTSTYIPDGILKDATTYTWNIQAIDLYGGKTASQSQTFTTDNTNGLPGIIKGYLRNAAGMPIANATISSGTTPYTTLSNGSFIIVVPAGSYTINAAATGYQAKSLSGVSVTSGKVVDASMTLTVAAASSKPGDCDNSGTVTIAEVQSAINMFLGLRTVEACVDVDNSNSVSIAEVQKVINSFLGL